MAERARGLLSSPFFDFAPWIVMSVIVGPQRFVTRLLAEEEAELESGVAAR